MADVMGSSAGRGRTRGWGLALALAWLGATGCSLDKLLNADQLPPNITDPAVTETADGARTVYNGVLAYFRQVFGGLGTNWSVVRIGGVFTDELIVPAGGTEDLRTFPEGVELSDDPYSTLQKIRGQGAQAIGLLTDFATGTQGLIAQAYAVTGYAEVFLAELYCSGIPLSTLNYKGDYTLKPGSTTLEVFTHAAALFDTTLALAGDSVPKLQSMAAVGKARALLALGQYAAAAAAVANVPDDYHYDVRFGDAGTYGNDNSGSGPLNFGGGPFNTSSGVADQEGENGLDYVSSNDPRVVVTFHPSTTQGNGFVLPAYNEANKLGAGLGSIILASGVEARLIEAEAALQAEDASAWLTKLNALRTDGTYDLTADTPPDTLWHAGTGRVAGLKPLTDPGTTDARVDLLFRERAFWLFLTGHRQGDLRRLVRQYGRSPGDVYPRGPYFLSPFIYGGDVTLPIPPNEQLSNPLFTGCASRGA